MPGLRSVMATAVQLELIAVTNALAEKDASAITEEDLAPLAALLEQLSSLGPPPPYPYLCCHAAPPPPPPPPPPTPLHVRQRHHCDRTIEDLVGRAMCLQLEATQLSAITYYGVHEDDASTIGVFVLPPGESSVDTTVPPAKVLHTG